MVLVVFPAIAYVGVTILSDWDGLSGSDGDDGAAAETTEDEPTDDAAAPETPEEPAETPTETESTEPAPPPAPPLNPARAVEVYNSTNRSGLAAEASGRLEAAGFTDLTTGNWSGDDPAASVVYYATPDDVTTAQTIAQTLGISQFVESAELAPDGIVVVLAGDYQEA